jgi:predicted outer membrane repeat protein
MTVVGGSMLVEDCVFEENQAPNGGALYVSGSASVVMRRTSFARNVAFAQGGALYMSGGDLILEDGTVMRGNVANISVSSLQLEAGELIYALPGPLGGWVSATECKPRTYPCPPGSTTSTCNSSTQPLLPDAQQPCDFRARPELVSRWLSYLTFDPINDDYP